MSQLAYTLVYSYHVLLLMSTRIETRETLCPRCQKQAARRRGEDAEQLWEKSDRAEAKAGAEVIVIED